MWRFHWSPSIHGDCADKFDRQQRLASLKILTAECTTHSRELEILRALQEDEFVHNVVRLLDSFLHTGVTGPNGTHQCLVLELLGPSVHHVIRNDYSPEDPLGSYTILRITRQLLQGLASVHAAGYAQGGKTTPT